MPPLVDAAVQRGETVQSEQQVTMDNTGATVEGMKRKVDALWDWKQFFSGKWVMFGCVALLVTSALLKFGLDMLVAWYKHP